MKLEDYAAHGTKEYWIVDPDHRTIEQYLIDADAGVYHLAGKFGRGEIMSFSFPGLSVPLAAFFEEDANLAFLRIILR